MSPTLSSFIVAHPSTNNVHAGGENVLVDFGSKSFEMRFASAWDFISVLGM